jgi:ABC-type sugar transport system substrate-binding protein
MKDIRHSLGRLLPSKISRSGAKTASALGALALVLAGTATVGQGVAGASGGSGKKINLVLILDDLTNPVELPLRKGAQDAASHFGFSLKIVGPSPATAQQQITLLQDEAATHPNGIVILPVNSTALIPEINKVVASGIPLATTETDAPGSKRDFFYFSGSPTTVEGQMSAEKVFAYFTARHSTGTINYVITSCLPTITGQQQRRSGFEQEAALLNKTSKFKLVETGFYDTTTDPATNLSDITNIYTAKQGHIGLAYAMCGPDTQDWGTVLRQNHDRSILVAGYNWLPQILNLIQEGWVGWSLNESLYGEGYYTMMKLYQHAATGAPLPTGATYGTSTFATPANLAQVRKSPDVIYGNG